jgi:hypothetical protein
MSGLVVPVCPLRGKAEEPLRRLDCRKFRKCGREPGGRKVEEFEDSPAAGDRERRRPIPRAQSMYL